MRLRGRGEEGRRRGRAWTATASAAPTTPTPAAGAGSLGSASGDKAHLVIYCLLYIYCVYCYTVSRIRFLRDFDSCLFFDRFRRDGPLVPSPNPLCNFDLNTGPLSQQPRGPCRHPDQRPFLSLKWWAVAQGESPDPHTDPRRSAQWSRGWGTGRQEGTPRATGCCSSAG